ncbi:hypothetical protein DFJ73DRAFT_773715 [Zopfochytrium polystomum]|nr:hypothetical protein DFJ73DRAFT_773715 [Zopfochytrium polystomum]
MIILMSLRMPESVHTVAGSLKWYPTDAAPVGTTASAPAMIKHDICPTASTMTTATPSGEWASTLATLLGSPNDSELSKKGANAPVNGSYTTALTKAPLHKLAINEELERQSPVPDREAAISSKRASIHTTPPTPTPSTDGRVG